MEDMKVVSASLGKPMKMAEMRQAVGGYNDAAKVRIKIREIGDSGQVHSGDLHEVKPIDRTKSAPDVPHWDDPGPLLVSEATGNGSKTGLTVGDLRKKTAEEPDKMEVHIGVEVDRGRWVVGWLHDVRSIETPEGLRIPLMVGEERRGAHHTVGFM